MCGLVKYRSKLTGNENHVRAIYSIHGLKKNTRHEVFASERLSLSDATKDSPVAQATTMVSAEHSTVSVNCISAYTIYCQGRWPT